MMTEKETGKIEATLANIEKGMERIEKGQESINRDLKENFVNKQQLIATSLEIRAAYTMDINGLRSSLQQQIDQLDEKQKVSEAKISVLKWMGGALWGATIAVLGLLKTFNKL